MSTDTTEIEDGDRPQWERTGEDIAQQFVTNSLHRETLAARIDGAIEFATVARDKRIADLGAGLRRLYVQVVNGRTDADLIVELGDSELLHAISNARALLSTKTEAGT